MYNIHSAPKDTGCELFFYRIYEESHTRCMAIVSPLFLRWDITKFTFRVYIM